MAEFLKFLHDALERSLPVAVITGSLAVVAHLNTALHFLENQISNSDFQRLSQIRDSLIHPGSDLDVVTVNGQKNDTNLDMVIPGNIGSYERASAVNKNGTRFESGKHSMDIICKIGYTISYVEIDGVKYLPLHQLLSLYRDAVEDLDSRSEKYERAVLKVEALEFLTNLYDQIADRQFMMDWELQFMQKLEIETYESLVAPRASSILVSRYDMSPCAFSVEGSDSAVRKLFF